VTCYTQLCKPCEVKYILHYLPQGGESSPRGSWGICAPALPEVLTNKCKDPRGGIHPDVQHLPHRAAHLLNCLRVSGETIATKLAPWTLQQKLAALNRRSHQSAKKHVEFLYGEFVDMIEKGKWILLPATLSLSNRNLREIPLGVVPQCKRRPRTICDYSFFLVNEDTVELCPEESMQFGRALLRILHKNRSL
jgi:hypothetical protein